MKMISFDASAAMLITLLLTSTVLFLLTHHLVHAKDHRDFPADYSVGKTSKRGISDPWDKEIVTITGTQNCQLTRDPVSGCKTTYRAGVNWQQCYLKEILKELDGALDLKDLTGNFINPEIFSLKSVSLDSCALDTTIAVVSREPRDTACGYFKVRAGGEYNVSWKSNAKDMKDVKINGNSMISLGENDNNLITFASVYGEETVNISTNVAGNGELKVENFIKKFDIRMTELFPENIKNVLTRLNPSALVMSQARIKGVIFPGSSFEIFATGKFKTPFLLQKVTFPFLIAQYFQEDPEPGQEESKVVKVIRPSVALVFPFTSSKKSDFISAVDILTGLQIPTFNLIEKIHNFAFTVATNDIPLVYCEQLKVIMDKFYTLEDQQLAYRGANFRFRRPGIIKELKTLDARIDKSFLKPKVSIRGDIENSLITFTIVEATTMTLEALPKFAVSSDENMLSPIKEIIERPGSTMFDSVVFSQKGLTRRFTVSGNLTDKMTIVPQIFSLQHVTFIFTTEKSGRGPFPPWTLNATGENSFLDELNNITTILNNRGEYILRADSDIFLMYMLGNRTQATYLRPEEKPLFTHIDDLSLLDLRYEVPLGKDTNFVRFFGKVVISGCKNSSVEVIYWMCGSVPCLAVGFVCRNSRMHEVINGIYDQEGLSQTWMTFDKIGVAMTRVPRTIPFEDEFLEKSANQKGVIVITEGLQLDKADANDTFAKMGKLLRSNYGDKMELQYSGACQGEHFNGKLRPAFEMEARVEKGMCLEGPLQITGITSVIKRFSKGEFARFEGSCYFRHADFRIKCSAFVDGSGELRLRVKQKPFPSSDKLLPLSFLNLYKVRGIMEYAYDKCPDGVYLQSGMEIGLNPTKILTVRKSTANQYISFQDASQHTFSGKVDQAVSLDNILDAFRIPSRLKLLKGSKCTTSVVVAYSGGGRDVWIPDFNTTISSGLHFFCYMDTIGEKRFVDCTYKEEENMLCEVFIESPLNISNGFLLMTQSKEQSSFGPAFVASFGPNEAEASLSGYVQAVGIEAPCSFSVRDGMRNGEETGLYRMQMEGKIYDEIQATAIIRGYGSLPGTLFLKFKMDLTKQMASQLPSKLLEELKASREEIITRKKKIADRADEDEKNYKDTEKRTRTLNEELNSAIKEIQALDQNIKDSSLVLSSECLDRARSVDMPGLNIDEQCIRENGGKTSVCVKWEKNEAKAVKVSDLIRCEAEKVNISLKIEKEVRNIRFLLNNIVLKKGQIENEKEIMKIREEMKDSSARIKDFVEKNVSVASVLEDAISNAEKSNSFFTLKTLKTSAYLHTITPPKHKYTTRWEINGQHFNSELEVTHMFPFIDSLTDEIIKVSFPQLVDAQDILQEGEYLSGEVLNLELRLNNSIKYMNEKKRSSVPGSHPHKLLGDEHSYLLRYGDPRIPQFTVVSDSTTHAFRYFSPWEVVRQSNPFEFLASKEKTVAAKMTGNATNDCGSVRSLILAFDTFVNDIDRMGNNFQKGKESLRENQLLFRKDLEECNNYVHAMALESKADNDDVQAMSYWLNYAKKGLGEYETQCEGRMNQHNRDVFRVYRDEINNAYGGKGEQSVVDYLSSLKSDAKQRLKRGTIAKVNGEQAMESIDKITQDFSSLMSRYDIGLEYAMTKLPELRSQLAAIRSNTKRCF